MGIQINGATDSITAIDGTIDVVSAIGNAGVVTATAFVGNITGNVTGNINHTSNLELQVGGVTRANIDSTGKVGINQSSPDYELDVTGRIGFTQQIRGASGTQGAPSYAFDGDHDSGMFRNGINNLCFATAGIQRLTIDENGKLGLGVNASNPTYQLQIHESDNTAYAANATVAQLAVGNVNSSSATNAAGIHLFTDGNGRGLVNLCALNNSTNSSADFVIQTRHSATTGERLRITSNGKLLVGIHTTSEAYTWAPRARFAVENSGDASSIHFGLRAGGSADPAIMMLRRGGSSAWGHHVGRIYTDYNPTIYFQTAFASTPGNENFQTQMVMKHNAGVGIGTISPNLLLHLHQENSNATFAHFTNTTTGVNANQGVSFGLDSDENAVIYHYGSKAIRFATGGTERLRVKSNGHAGIGTNDPLNRLHVRIQRGNSTGLTASAALDSGNNLYLPATRLENSGMSGNIEVGQLFLAGNTDQAQWLISCKKTGANVGDFIFRTRTGASASAERLRITSAGNVESVGIVTAKNFNPTDSQLSHRNIVINGDMRVSQRANGTNIGNAGSYKYACDRFIIGLNGATVNITQDAPAAGSNTHPNGFRHSLKVQTHTAVGSVSAGNIMQIQYKFEGYQIARLGYGSGTLYNNPKSMTLSFWAKSSLTGTFCVNFQRDGRIINRQFTISSADTWEYFTATMPPDTSIVGQHENAQAMSMVFVFSAGSNYTGGSALANWINHHVAHTGYGVNMDHLTTANATFQITGVQLEEGTVATPFEFRDYNDQLKMCQRYYAIFHPTTQEQIYIESGSTNTHSFWNAPVPAGMRTEPSVNLLGTWTGHGMVGGRSVYAISVQGIDNGGNSGTAHPGSMGRASFRVTRDANGTYGDGEVRHVDGWGNGNAWIGYDAEL